jgi:ribonuclease J
MEEPVVVEITCYGGVNEIGGNKILVEDGDTRVFLDFGAGFSDGSEYFSAGIEPRRVNGAGDYFEFGLLPELRGLYSEDALQNTRLKHSGPEIDAILLSHYHSDHTRRIEFVDPEIPVYCGETTRLIHEASSESGGSALDHHVIRTFRTGDRFRIGRIEVQPIHVDHSIPGAYGYILHTSEGAIAYTGDFRFHGPMGEMTQDFIAEASKAKPIALITEGTRVSDADHKQELSEAEVAREAIGVLRGAKRRFVFSSFRGNDMDRVASFYRACEETGRNLVVSMKVAMLLEKLRSDKYLKVPRVGKDVSVYLRRKGKGTFDDREYYKWERKFLDAGITATEVNLKQEKMFLHLDQWSFPELIDIKPARGGSYIHATTEAFNEEGEQDEEVVRNWVDHYGLGYYQIHASGHAPMAKVGYLVSSVKARTVVPIHTDRPELFSSFTEESRLFLPTKGKKMRLG